MPPLWYHLLLAVILPLYRLRVWQRSRLQPDYAQEVAQRFGGFAPARTQGAVWIHAVSVGETNAAQPVIQFFLDQGRAVLVTNTTRTGQARLRQLFGERVESVFLPVDTVGLMTQFFDHYQPRVIGLIETELWPNLLALAHQPSCSMPDSPKNPPKAMPNLRPLPDPCWSNSPKLPRKIKPPQIVLSHSVRHLIEWW